MRTGNRNRPLLVERWPAAAIVVFGAVVSFEIGWFYDWTLALVCGIAPILLTCLIAWIGLQRITNVDRWYGAWLLTLAISTAICGFLHVPIQYYVSPPATADQFGLWVIESALTVDLGVLEAVASALLLPKQRGVILPLAFLLFVIACLSGQAALRAFGAAGA